MNPGSPPTSDGRGTRAGRHGGRTTGWGGRSSRQNMAPTISRHRFEGATEELKGEIFDSVRPTYLSNPKKQLPTTSDKHINIQGI